MNLGLLLLIVFLVLLIGSAPVYPYSRSWGYAPMGGLGTLLVIILVLILLGIIPFGGPVAPTPVTVP